ncbi:unnamed protein product [Ilex paraguariensis]|uniref:Uncharacterized protein n=1 Tax=Ilex paraguariensis TaxID=185542 RepID=A0ABC8V0V5_9AQUA
MVPSGVAARSLVPREVVLNRWCLVVWMVENKREKGGGNSPRHWTGGCAQWLELLHRPWCLADLCSVAGASRICAQSMVPSGVVAQSLVPREIVLNRWCLVVWMARFRAKKSGTLSMVPSGVAARSLVPREVVLNRWCLVVWMVENKREKGGGNSPRHWTGGCAQWLELLHRPWCLADLCSVAGASRICAQSMVPSGVVAQSLVPREIVLNRWCLVVWMARFRAKKSGTLVD